MLVGGNSIFKTAFAYLYEFAVSNKSKKISIDLRVIVDRTELIDFQKGKTQKLATEIEWYSVEEVENND